MEYIIIYRHREAAKRLAVAIQEDVAMLPGLLHPQRARVRNDAKR